MASCFWPIAMSGWLRIQRFCPLQSFLIQNVPFSGRFSKNAITPFADTHSLSTCATRAFLLDRCLRT